MPRAIGGGYHAPLISRPKRGQKLELGRFLRVVEIAKCPEADMSRPTDDQMIQQPNSNRVGGALQIPGHIDIGPRWAWVAGRMIVRHDNRLRIEYDRTLDNLPRVDGH